MNRTPFTSSLPRLGRFAFIIGACVVSAALLGASEARATAKTSPKASNSHKVAIKKVVKTPASVAGRELMHNIAAPAAGEAMLASATLPGLGSQTPGTHKKVIWMIVTAYCGCTKCCGPHAHGLTASGRSVAYNGGQFVAADKKLFKFGTQLEIPGYAGGQPVEVIDRGGAIKGYHIDVFFPTHEQAREWGRKWMAITVDE
jgi:3D (Asp-Asp-Asp) domain-containing protein